MLERTVKQKNKYKSDLEVCRNENSLLKLQMDAMKKRLNAELSLKDSFLTFKSEGFDFQSDKS
tara:strand:- start:381 stop:569 length:189 start_codon:yes stop_codon:yes gene_type:complete